MLRLFLRYADLRLLNIDLDGSRIEDLAKQIDSNFYFSIYIKKRNIPQE